VQRNLRPLVAAYLPGALIADRTALENRPAVDGSVFQGAGEIDLGGADGDSRGGSAL